MINLFGHIKMYSFCTMKESTQKSKYKDGLRGNVLISVQRKYYYLDQHCPIELFGMMKSSLCAPQQELLRTWNVTTVTEELNSEFYLIKLISL